MEGLKGGWLIGWGCRPLIGQERRRGAEVGGSQMCMAAVNKMASTYHAIIPNKMTVF